MASFKRLLRFSSRSLMSSFRWRRRTWLCYLPATTLPLLRLWCARAIGLTAAFLLVCCLALLHLANCLLPVCFGRTSNMLRFRLHVLTIGHGPRSSAAALAGSERAPLRKLLLFLLLHLPSRLMRLRLLTSMAWRLAGPGPLALMTGMRLTLYFQMVFGPRAASVFSRKARCALVMTARKVSSMLQPPHMRAYHVTEPTSLLAWLTCITQF